MWSTTLELCPNKLLSFRCFHAHVKINTFFFVFMREWGKIPILPIGEWCVPISKAHAKWNVGGKKTIHLSFHRLSATRCKKRRISQTIFAICLFVCMIWIVVLHCSWLKWRENYENTDCIIKKEREKKEPTQFGSSRLNSPSFTYGSDIIWHSILMMKNPSSHMMSTCRHGELFVVKH